MHSNENRLQIPKFFYRGTNCEWFFLNFIKYSEKLKKTIIVSVRKFFDIKIIFKKFLLISGKERMNKIRKLNDLHQANECSLNPLPLARACPVTTHRTGRLDTDHWNRRLFSNKFIFRAYHGSVGCCEHGAWCSLTPGSGRYTDFSKFNIWSENEFGALLLTKIIRIAWTFQSKLPSNEK